MPITGFEWVDYHYEMDIALEMIKNVNDTDYLQNYKGAVDAANQQKDWNPNKGLKIYFMTVFNTILVC